MSCTSFMLICLVRLVIAICDHGTAFFPRAVGSVHIADFGFNEINGPLNWHNLDRDNAKCATGTSQSPININSSVVPGSSGSSLDVQLDDAPSGVNLANVGSTVEAEAHGTLELNGKNYTLVQFHFHTPSEHRIDSEHYAMEVHFVFQAQDQSLSVLGIPIELGTKGTSCLLTSIFQNITEIASPGTVTKTGPLQFTKLINHVASANVFQYSGSLTTPPCTEGIAWNIVQQPIYIDLTTYRAAKSIIKFNSRFSQNAPNEVNLLSNACPV